LEKETLVTLDTRFRIASISKTFTATAILQLRDAGKLKLDDPVSQYLDWFDLGYDGAPPITLRQLLTHTSGLPRDATTPHWTEHAFQSWEELVATTKQRKPMMRPLVEMSYSNLGYSLLGGVVERVSDTAWADYIQQNILNPLDMADTVVAPNGQEANLATGYLGPDDQHHYLPAPFAATNGFSASASMASSVNDLVKYARFHLSMQDNPVLSSHSLREMHQVHWLDKDWKGGYGLGTFVLHIGDWTITGHSGGYTGYLTQFTVCREHQFGVIVLTNSLNSNPIQFVERAYNTVLPEVLNVTKPRTPEAKPEWQRWVGTYQSDWNDTEIVIRGGQLQMVSHRFLDSPPTILDPTELPHEFIIRVPGNPGETVRFELDDAGNVKRVWVRNEYLLPKT
jgi:D-alanyl-D-alanine carboxypeptidase